MTKPHYRRTAAGDTLPSIRSDGYVNQSAKVSDGFQNIVANLGTSRDKSAANTYVRAHLSFGDLATAYEVSSIAQGIVDLPAEDACREWREWQASASQITAIEKEEKRLGVTRKVMQALKWARLFGGSAIYLGTNDTDLSKPLNLDMIRKNGLKYITVLDRMDLSVTDMQNDPSVRGYGLPKFYQMTTGSEPLLDIHPSRMIVFRGPEFPDRQRRQANMGWGDSVLTATLEKVKHLDSSVANVAALVFEAKVDVVRIKNFTENLRSGGDDYENLMLRRFALAMAGKGINGTLMLDKDEEYDQKSASFANLDKLLDRFMQIVSSAARIPVTRLFRTSPGGMNSTGESDTRSYYDDVKKSQTLEIEPALYFLDECLIRSALGSRPDDVHYNWRPLWQPTEKERAEVADKLTTAIEKLHRMGIIDEEAIAEAAVNALTESGAFPGLEGSVEKYYSGKGNDDDDSGDDLMISDASPKTLYVSRKVKNASEIIRWAKKQGFNTTLPAEDLHVTIAFSREPVDWMEVGQSWSAQIDVPPGGPRMMERFGEANVLLFSSDELNWRHERIKEAGATWDHPEYQSHITISYDPDAPSVGDIEPYQGPIVLGPEIFQEVNEDWKEKVEEK